MSEQARERDQHIAIAREKLHRFLVLADEIIALRQQIQQTLDQQATVRDTLRNRVLIGLKLKALDSFDRLVLDAREQRAECSHHLKTMSECCIYTGWLTKDTGDTRARLLIAEGHRSRAAYHDAIDEKEMASQWKEQQKRELEGLDDEWKDFRDNKKIAQIAEEGNRQDDYYRIYRLACEAAHLGDLFVYVSPQPVEPGINLSDLSLLRAYVCLKFGVMLACDLLHEVSDALGMRLEHRIQAFRTRHKEIIALGAADAVERQERPPDRDS
jgi:hypothetical protein